MKRKATRKVQAKAAGAGTAVGLGLGALAAVAALWKMGKLAEDWARRWPWLNR